MGAADRQLVEGFTDRRSYEPGERVALHLAVTRPGLLGDVVPGDRSHAVTVVVARVGATRDEVWRASDVVVEPQAIPDDASTVGVDWPVVVELDVPPGWAPGWYEVALHTTADDGEPALAHAGFVVRAPTGAPTAPRLLVLATNTWNAYNDWGGPNLYTGGSQVSFARPWARGYVDRPDPFTNRNASAVPLPDPDVVRWTRYVLDTRVSPWSGCAGWPSWESLFVAWAERAGYALDFATNADLAERPEVVDGHPLLLSVGHDEYWSWEMRDTVEQHVDAGGHVAFLSGNTAFWQVRSEDGGRTMVGHKVGAGDHDPVVGTDREPRLTSMWSDPRTGRPETRMTGVTFTRGGYARMGVGVPRGAGGYTVWRPEHWLFEGTDLRYGDLLGAEHTVVGYECDGCALTLRDGRPEPTHEDGCPDGFEVLGTAPAHLWSKDEHHDEYPAGLSALRTIGELQETAIILFGDDSPDNVRRIAQGHAVLGSYVRGGTVVTTGCTDWTFGLAGGDEVVERVTRNILDRLSAT